MRRLDPRQLAAIEHIYSRANWLLLADVGTGKTVMVLTAYQRLRDERRVGRGIVLAPLRVCSHVWPYEAAEWAHLAGVDVVSAAGMPAARRRALLESSADLVALNYESIPWLTETYPAGVRGRNVIIMDEVDKLKAVGTARWKALCGKTARSTGWLDRAGIVWRGGMTGTPRPNHYSDLYGQVVAADCRDRLLVEINGIRSRSFYDWREVHFDSNPYEPYTFTLRPGHAEGIESQIAPITHRLAARPGVEVPHVKTLPPRTVALPAAARKVYRELESEYVVLFRRQLDGELTTVEAQHAGALYAKLRQIGQGFLYVPAPDTAGKGPETPADALGPAPAALTNPGATNGVQAARQDVEWLSDAKLRELRSLVSELQGEQAMIVYHFRAQRAQLAGEFVHSIGFLDSAAEHQNRRVIDRWNAGELPLLAVHPQSAGHGLNLQHSGAHHVIMLTMPESAGQVQQVVGRLARRGAGIDTVFVHPIVTGGTVDADRLAVVEGKGIDQREMLARMEARTQHLVG